MQFWLAACLRLMSPTSTMFLSLAESSWFQLEGEGVALGDSLWYGSHLCCLDLLERSKMLYPLGALSGIQGTN